MRFLEGESEGANDGDGDKSELHLKFKFPTFDEFSRIRRVREDSYNPELFSSAFIEVLTTFPLREINGDKAEEEKEKIDATEFAENKVILETRDSVDDFEFYSEISSDGFLSDGDLGVDSDSFGVNKESPMFLSGDSFELSSDNQNGGGFLSVDEMVESEQKESLVFDSGDALLEAEGTLVGSSRPEKDCSLFDNDRATNKLDSLWEHHESPILVEDMGESEPKESLVEGTLVGSSLAEKDCSLFDNDRATNKLGSWEHHESPISVKDMGESKPKESLVLDSGDGLSEAEGTPVGSSPTKKDCSLFDNNRARSKLESLVLGSGDGLFEAEGTLLGSSRTEKYCSLSDNDRATNKLESLWEHQELIEQLQMELRKVKATGLPTIVEESESPKIIDDLKPPWKIEDNDTLQHQDCMGELHRFYKSYREMMRKFDILNYQKMYAMGFLQLKDPFQPKSQQKLNSAPMLKSLVSQKLWMFKHKKQGSNPIKKLINELQGDVEVVYVGQMCLSWEFLHWQYEKALELWSSDPQGIHRYNEVAAEIQQFQVLVQRFTEDEPFQGTRVQSYAKTRCVLRNLLQVPLIREDCLEDKSISMKKEKDEYVITSEMLVEMIEESIRIFWEFIRLDKDCCVASNIAHNKLPELHSPQDLKLWMELRKNLQKKERKLKDILRSEKCILRKFQKQRRDDLDQALHFFAQVDVKLVSRVFNMSTITRDQLIWCENKLSKISFVNRKIYVEPAFLLFPC